MNMRIAKPIAAAILALALAQCAQAMTFADFEQSSGYPAAPALLIGVDGWVGFAGGTIGLTPDPYPPGSGYVTVLQGSQSAWVCCGNGVARPWGSTASIITNEFVVSALFYGPDHQSDAATIYFGNDAANGNTPGGIEVAGSHFNIFGASGSVNSGVSYTLAHEYRLSMAIDIPNWQFTPTIEDLTVPSSSTPGTYAMYPYPSPPSPAGMMTLAYVQAHGGLIFGGAGVWDDIQVNAPAIPEPASLALLGLGGLLLLRLRR